MSLPSALYGSHPVMLHVSDTVPGILRVSHTSRDQ